MKFSCDSIVAFLLLGALSTVDASFLRDVVGQKKAAPQNSMEKELHEKAVPLEEYRASLRAKGFDIPDQNSRELYYDDDKYNNDDYTNNANGYYKKSFASYSLKYGKCQPVERFSEEALQNGESSPLVVDDIVVLRLCPSDFCMSSTMFGCLYNYAEYAIGLSDYVQIMLKYRQQKSQQLCNWCDACYSRRNLANNGDDDKNGDDQVNNGDDDDYFTGDDGGYYSGYYHDCSNFEDYCYLSDDEEGYSACQDYLTNDGSEYFDYLECTNIKNNNNVQYFTRPRCDAHNQIIHMGIFYDESCKEYAGDDVELKYFNLPYNYTRFENYFSEKQCLPCEKSSEPPYFTANSNLCNRMHFESETAVCTGHLNDYYLSYSSNSNYDATACTYIQSVRTGNYNEDGGLIDGGTGSLAPVITHGERVTLLVTVAILVYLLAFATYLNHKTKSILLDSYLGVTQTVHKMGRFGRKSTTTSQASTVSGI